MCKLMSGITLGCQLGGGGTMMVSADYSKIHCFRYAWTKLHVVTQDQRAQGHTLVGLSEPYDTMIIINATNCRLSTKPSYSPSTVQGL